MLLEGSRKEHRERKKMVSQISDIFTFTLQYDIVLSKKRNYDRLQVLCMSSFKEIWGDKENWRGSHSRWEISADLCGFCVCAQLCLILCEPMEFSGQEYWSAISSSRGSSQPRDWTPVPCVSCTEGRFFTTEPPEKPLVYARQQMDGERLNVIWKELQHGVWTSGIQLWRKQNMPWRT